MKFSFEFFPPKNDMLLKKLWDTVTKLIFLDPNFFSVTCTTNNTQNSTFDIVKTIQNKTKVITAPHLTCINFNRSELEKKALNFWKNGIRSIVALRGDVINNSKNVSTMYATDLVCLLKKIANFDISVAAYPEVHPYAKDAKSDLLNLKKKIDNGANRAITQFFFDIDKYLKFRDNCVKIGINVDIIPGILPILNFEQLKKFSAMTNVNIPRKVYESFEKLTDDFEVQKIIGSNIIINMVEKLYREGVTSFHFYTLNNADLVYAICHILKN